MKCLRIKGFLVFLFALFVFDLAAQDEMVVTSFKLLEKDLTANLQGSIEYDQNGEVAALIKIVTTEQGFVFDGGMMGVVKSVQKTGQIWLYVPHGIKKISIYHQQLGSLREYYFPINIEKARTYEMVLSTGKVETIVRKSAGKQYVTFRVSPANAMIELDNEFLSVNNDGYAEKAMPYGEYGYRVSCNNYHTEAGKLQVGSNGKTELTINLRPNFGWLRLDSEEEYHGAQVYVDGERLGVVPFTSGEMKSGTHRIRLVKPMYASYEQEVQIFDNQVCSLNVSMNPNFAKVSIETDDQAEIYIDGRYMATGVWVGNLEPADYTLEIKKESHRSLSEVLHVVDYSPRKIRLTALAPIHGYLDISSVPSDASVYVDGVYRGQTPLFLSDVLVGDRKVSVKKDGYNQEDKVLNLKEMSEEKLTLQLEKKPTQAMVNVASSPSKADVHIDGDYVGKTPLTLPLTLGEHYFHLNKSDKYYTVSELRTISNPGGEYQSFVIRRKPKAPKEVPNYALGYAGLSVYANVDVHKNFFPPKDYGFGLQLGINSLFWNFEYLYQYDFYERNELRIGLALPVKNILLTPQFGMAYYTDLPFDSDSYDETTYIADTYTFAVCARYCLNNFFSFILTPEYTWVSKDAGIPWNRAENIQGFSLRLGFSVSLALDSSEL